MDWVGGRRTMRLVLFDTEVTEETRRAQSRQPAVFYTKRGSAEMVRPQGVPRRGDEMGALKGN